MTAALALVVVGAVWFVYQQRISAQEDRNRFLKGEIAKLDKEIDEIKDVKDKIAALLARKQVIETLQTDRVQTVYLLDELVRQMPEGVFLKSVKQRAPNLIEIKAANLGKMRISEFNMKLALKRPTAPEAKDGAAKDAGAKDAAKKG
jgi:type IV pilus assembly protein PilN